MSFIVQPLQFKVLSRELGEYLTFLYLSFTPRPAGSSLKISPGIFLCRKHGSLCGVLEPGKRNVQNISIKCVARPIAPDEIEIRSRVGNPARASHIFILCNPPNNPARSSPTASFAQKIRVLEYILSEHKSSKAKPKARPPYPLFAPILSLHFSKGRLPRLSDCFYRRVWFFYWLTLLFFWYNKISKGGLR